MPELRLQKTRQAYDSETGIGIRYRTDWDMGCPDCGQPADILTTRTHVETHPQTGVSTLVRDETRFCPNAFHFIVPGQ